MLIDEYRMSVLAVYSLAIAHPGPIFAGSDANIYESNVTASSDGFTGNAEPEMSAMRQNV